MPELPDIVVYCEALDARLRGQALVDARIDNPFVLRTVDPPLASLAGNRVVDIRRSGKRIVLAFEDDLYLVVHLMIAGRLRWLMPQAKPPARITLAHLVFANGTLVLTEAGTKRRASLHVLRGGEGLATLDTAGLDVERADVASFAARMRAENHTLKRALTDPRVLDGIGNAYSDEILHRARLSPLAHTARLDDAQMARLHAAARDVLREWTDRLRAEAKDTFPGKVTAFRPGMAVHGRFRQPCPVCGTPVQRIVYAENECNYCPTCQTNGVLLADRALSRLLHKSYPRQLRR
jgi:formamidopyrimidine-DNA glycosylase